MNTARFELGQRCRPGVAAQSPGACHRRVEDAQGNPCNGVTLDEQARGVSPLEVPAGKPLDIVELCRALGVDEVTLVDSQDAAEIRRALEEAVAHTDKLSVLVFRSPCRLIDRSRRPQPVVEGCQGCGTCIQIGCPALGCDEDELAVIDPNQCIGCNQCVQSCPFGCIQKGE